MDDGSDEDNCCSSDDGDHNGMDLDNQGVGHDLFVSETNNHNLDWGIGYSDAKSIGQESYGGWDSGGVKSRKANYYTYYGFVWRNLSLLP